MAVLSSTKFQKKEIKTISSIASAILGLSALGIGVNAVPNNTLPNEIIVHSSNDNVTNI